MRMTIAIEFTIRDGTNRANDKRKNYNRRQ